MTTAVITDDIHDARRSPQIDLHAHMVEPTALEAGVSHSVITGFGARALPPAAPGSAQEMAQRAGHDPAEHIRRLDRLGLDAEVVSSMTVMQGTGWGRPSSTISSTAGSTTRSRAGCPNIRRGRSGASPCRCRVKRSAGASWSGAATSCR